MKSRIIYTSNFTHPQFKELERIGKTSFLKVVAVALTVAVMAFGLSCKDKDAFVEPDAPSDAPSLSVTPKVNEIVFAADGRAAIVGGAVINLPSVVFKVETNQGPWEVITSAPWVGITVNSANSSEFYLTAKSVITGDTPPEPAEVTVTAGDAPPVVMRVQQIAPESALLVTPEYRNIVLSVNGKTAWEGINSFQPVFSVSANTTTSQWDVQSDQSWLTIVQDKEKNTFTLTGDANAGDGPFLNAKVTVTAEGAFPITITVIHIVHTPPKPPSHVVMNIRRNPKTQMAFNWLTDPGAFAGIVEIVQGKATSHDVFASPYKTVNSTIDNITNLRYNASENRSYVVHKALAEDLTPSTTYSYRVGYDGSWSDIGTFTTAGDESEFTFLYTTDPQSTTTSDFQIAASTIQTAYNLFPDVKFQMTCGDLVDQNSGISAWEWEQFFETQQDIFYKLPFAPVMGNHDAYLPNSFVYYFNLEPTPAALTATSHTKPGSVYSFVYGDALFVGLNFEDITLNGYSEALGNWMRAEVNKPEHAHVRWRIAFFHSCMYTGGLYQSNDLSLNIINAMAPIFDELGIDIAFQGHNHIYQVIGPVYNKELVVGAATNITSTTVSHPLNSNGKAGGSYNTEKGTLYFLNSASGTKMYTPNNPVLSGFGVPNYPSLFTGRLSRPGIPAYSNVSVTRDEITITTYTVASEGSSVLFDEIKVWKPK